VKGQKENEILTRQKNRHSSRPDVFYFFTHRTFLKTILASRTLAHLPLPQPHKPTQGQSQKSQFF